MGQPRVYLGQQYEDPTNGDNLLRALFGATDADAQVDLLVQPAPIAPAGAGGECLFTRLFIPVTHTMGGDLLVTPVLDNVDQEQKTIALTASSVRTNRIIEVALSVPFLDGGTEKGRVGMRGTWFTVRIEKQAVSDDADEDPGDLIVNEPEVEYEVVRESDQADAV